MQSSPQIVSLNSICLPEPISRDTIPRNVLEHLRDAYKEKYDFSTLFCDAFYDESSHLLKLVCPKLLNFEVFFEERRLGVDHQFPNFRVSKFARYDLASCFLAERPTSISLDARDIGRFSCSVGARMTSEFAGRRVLLTLSKDNRISWICDWADHHVRLHGADALLLIDNGSTTYKLTDLVSRLQTVPGLEQLTVVDAPFLYGPNIPKPSKNLGSSWLKYPRGSGKARFLEPALLNLCKYRFLAEAESVLIVDIDEVVSTIGGESIFEMTSRSWLGYIEFKGRWFDVPSSVADPTHSDHTIRRDDLPECPTKYCISPRGRLKGMSWSVHSLENSWCLPFSRSRIASYAHLRKITTNWKGGRRLMV